MALNSGISFLQNIFINVAWFEKHHTCSQLKVTIAVSHVYSTFCNRFLAGPVKHLRKAIHVIQE